MTLIEFKTLYKCNFTKIEHGKESIEFLTEVIRRVDNKIYYTMKATVNIEPFFYQLSILEQNIEQIISQGKRFQLDLISQKENIQNFHPLDLVAHPDLSHMYE